MSEYVRTAAVYVAGLTPAGEPVVGEGLLRRGTSWLLVVIWPRMPENVHTATVVGMAPDPDAAREHARQAARDPWPWNETE